MSDSICRSVVKPIARRLTAAGSGIGVGGVTIPSGAEQALFFNSGLRTGTIRLADESRSGTVRDQQPGRFYTFDGTNDVVQLTNALADVRNVSGCTLMAYIKMSAFSGASNVIMYSTGSQSSLARAQIYIGTSGIVGAGGRALDSDSFQGGVSTGTVAIGTFAHVAATINYATNEIKIYINGVLDSTTSVSFGDTSTADSDSAAATIGKISTGQPLSGSIFDVLAFNNVLSIAEIIYLKTFGASGTDPGLDDCVLWDHCESTHPTTSYDSSGNGNDGTKTDITAATFNAEGNDAPFSYLDSVGYSLDGSGYTIPRDESDTANDVLGNPLDYVGECPRDGEVLQSNCATFNGTTEYLSAAHLAGTETVVSSGGTSTPSISAGRIDFTAGTCWALLLSDGTFYPMAEGAGDTHYDSVGGNHATVQNRGGAYWGTLQDVYHRNITNGFELYDDDATGNVIIRVPFNNDESKITPTISGYSKTSDNPAGNFHNGAESEINFNVEPLAVWTNGLTLETDYNFGTARNDPNFKTVVDATNKENEFFTAGS
jgi:hypothetical protein